MPARIMKHISANPRCSHPHSCELSITPMFPGTALRYCKRPQEPALEPLPAPCSGAGSWQGRQTFPADSASICPHLPQAAGSCSGASLRELRFTKEWVCQGGPGWVERDAPKRGLDGTVLTAQHHLRIHLFAIWKPSTTQNLFPVPFLPLTLSQHC